MSGRSYILLLSFLVFLSFAIVITSVEILEYLDWTFTMIGIAGVESRCKLKEAKVVSHRQTEMERFAYTYVFA